MQADTPMARARKELSGAIGRIEQMSANSYSMFDIREAEFEAVTKIAAALGITIDDEGHNQRIAELETALHAIWIAHGVVVSNGGAGWQRHVEPAIYAAAKLLTKEEG